MDSELQFEWPTTSGPTSRDVCSQEWRPLARRASDRRPPDSRSDDGEDPVLKLTEATATIARLEDDRRAARKRITELEAARDALQDRVTAQRRRLLLLERQLEGANLEPVNDGSATASWLDRLFGGLSSVPTG